jgi:hypothetical protein
MELTANHLFINIILASFAYAFILHQLKIFMLKSVAPFDDYSSAKPLSDDQYELNYLTASIVSLCIFILIFLFTVNGEYKKIFESTSSIIEHAVIVFFILISLYFTFINGRKRYRRNKEKIITDLPYFLVFEAISFAHYCAVPDEEGLMLFLGFANFCAAISYSGGMALLFMAKGAAYPIRIIIILICLALCMSGKFSILNWKF